MDLRCRLLDFSNRVAGGVRIMASRLTVFFDPKSKVFIDKGLYVVNKTSNPVLENLPDHIPALGSSVNSLVEDVIISEFNPEFVEPAVAEPAVAEPAVAEPAVAEPVSNIILREPETDFC